MTERETRIFEFNNLNKNAIEQKMLPLLGSSARQELIHNYHPDNLEQGKKSIDHGPNCGERLPSELVDLLQTNYHPPRPVKTEKQIC